MKFIAFFLTYMFIVSVSAQGPDYTEEFKLLDMQVKQTDIDKLTEGTQKNASLMANDICRCINENQSTLEKFSVAIKKYLNAKKSENNEEITAAKKGLDDLMNTMGAFMKCTMEHDKKFKDTDSNKEFEAELLKLHPEHAEHIERMVVIRNRYEMFYLQQNCPKNQPNFELFSNFMFGLIRGKY